MCRAQPGCVWVEATTIGHRDDLSARAIETLRRVAVIAAEDTRVSRHLLDAWGVVTPLMAAHQHNEARAAQDIIGRLEQGQRVALVSDAGAPAVSDPGARIVRSRGGLPRYSGTGAQCCYCGINGKRCHLGSEPGFCVCRFHAAQGHGP